MLPASFFNRDTLTVAQDLLGKVLRAKYQDLWLSAMIIETEAYYLWDKASHSSLGYTKKRKALFMHPGTIYMYYSRAGDSMNIKCRGKGNAVLIKSGIVYLESKETNGVLDLTLEYNSKIPFIQCMQNLNPRANGSLRSVERLCSGQTLLCKSLGLTVPKWDQKTFDSNQLYFQDIGYYPQQIIQTQRLGIAPERDTNLLYRFIDFKYRDFCTKNPLKRREYPFHNHYQIIQSKIKRFSLLNKI